MVQNEIIESTYLDYLVLIDKVMKLNKFNFAPCYFIHLCSKGMFYFLF